MPVLYKPRFIIVDFQNMFLVMQMGECDKSVSLINSTYNYLAFTSQYAPYNLYLNRSHLLRRVHYVKRILVSTIVMQMDNYCSHR